MFLTQNMSLFLNIAKKSKDLINKRTVFVALLVTTSILLYFMEGAYGYNVSNVVMAGLVATSLSVFPSSNHLVTVPNLTETITAEIKVNDDRVIIRTLQEKGLNSSEINQMKSTNVKIAKPNFKTLNNFSIQTGRTGPPDITTTLHPKDIAKFFMNTIAKSGLMQLLTLFDKLMTKHNVTYFMYGRTLIGSYRHHGMIPWDDDIDVILSTNLKGILQKIFSNVSTDYTLYIHPTCGGKLFSSRGRLIPRFAWSYPFLDIFFYGENATHIWDTCPHYKKEFCYPKTIIFPLRSRPFENLSLLAPRDTRAVISKTYNLDECKSVSYNHSVEKYMKWIKVQCSRLHSLYPFVTRKNVNGGCNETLIYKGNVSNVFYELGVAC